jgi:hypothetical protein
MSPIYLSFSPATGSFLFKIKNGLWQASPNDATPRLVFVWGEDARMAAALLSVINRKDFDASIFEGWFKGLITEYKELWKAPNIDTATYISVRTQTNVLVHLTAKIAAQKDNEIPKPFRDALNATLSQTD